MVPVGTPADIVERLRRGLQAMTEDDAFKAALEKLGERPRYLSAEALETFLEQDYQKVGAVLRQIIKKE
jgi:tripartite-type tricarboxylate transporter receptor subunit TctC